MNFITRNELLKQKFAEIDEAKEKLLEAKNDVEERLWRNIIYLAELDLALLEIK